MRQKNLSSVIQVGANSTASSQAWLRQGFHLGREESEMQAVVNRSGNMLWDPTATVASTLLGPLLPRELGCTVCQRIGD